MTSKVEELKAAVDVAWATYAAAHFTRADYDVSDAAYEIYAAAHDDWADAYIAAYAAELEKTKENK